jgi:hypothetical protein
MLMLIGFCFPSIRPFCHLPEFSPTFSHKRPSIYLLCLSVYTHPFLFPSITSVGASACSLCNSEYCLISIGKRVCCPSVHSEKGQEDYQLALLLARFLSTINIVQHTMRKSRMDLHKQRDLKVTFRSRCCWYDVEANRNNGNTAELAFHGSFSLEGKYLQQSTAAFVM